VRRTGGRTEAAGEQLHDALGVVEVIRPELAVPAARLSCAGQREREPPPLARRVARPCVALADLEHRNVLGAVPQVRADDVQQDADQVAAQHGGR
jgi:hypothetical protein